MPGNRNRPNRQSVDLLDRKHPTTTKWASSIHMNKYFVKRKVCFPYKDLVTLQMPYIAVLHRGVPYIALEGLAFAD